MSWFYAQHNQKKGPVSEQVICDLIERGELIHSSLVWSEGMDDWRPLSEVPCFHQFTRPVTEGGHGPEEESSGETKNSIPLGDPYASQHVQQVNPLQMPATHFRSQNLAIVSLVLSICALFFFCLTCVSFPLGLSGVICGHIAYSNAVNKPMEFYGKELALVGIVMGYLSLAGSMLTILFGMIS